MADGEILGLLQGLAGDGGDADRRPRRGIGGGIIEGQLIHAVRRQPIQPGQDRSPGIAAGRQHQIGIEDLFLGDNQFHAGRIGGAQLPDKLAEAIAQSIVENRLAQLGPGAAMAVQKQHPIGLKAQCEIPATGRGPCNHLLVHLLCLCRPALFFS